MLYFADCRDGIFFGRIITETVIRQLLTQGDYIRIIRSGVNAELEHCAPVIEEVCRNSPRPKQIRIVLPSILNTDLVVRAREAERCPEEVLAKLAAWHETLARLSKRLAPKHILEVRTTLDPHRYHAIFSESQAIFGLPWHSEASLTTSSFIASGEVAAGVISLLHKDFEVFFRKCVPYALGDNQHIEKATAARKIDEEVLHRFGKKLPKVFEILQYIVSSFPVAGGGGATNRHIFEKFGIEKSDANKWLLQMERAGLLIRAAEPKLKSGSKEEDDASDTCCGRLASWWGTSIAKKYKDYRFD